jgi:hypothetical protein
MTSPEDDTDSGSDSQGGRSYDNRPEAISLLANLRAALLALEALFEEFSSHWGFEDPVYRFYHQSFKVYRLQEATARIVEALRALAPNRELDERFLQIVAEGTSRTFEMDHNARWLSETRPILEAFFHARYFLEMAVRYAKELERPPRVLPSGWAALLGLYRLR